MHMPPTRQGINPESHMYKARGNDRYGRDNYGLASKIVLSLDRIRSYLVTKSSHISDTHGESTHVSILAR